MTCEHRFRRMLGAGVLLTLVALASAPPPASAQDPNCMWGPNDVLCQSSGLAGEIEGWIQGEIARQDLERAQGNRRPWYQSETMPAQERLARELRDMGLLEPGWNDRPHSVAVGEDVARGMRRAEALAPACRDGDAAACAELDRLREVEARRSRAIEEAFGLMAADNERLERSNRMRRDELGSRYRTQAIELRGQADRLDVLAEQAFLTDDFAAGRYYSEQAATLRRQAETLDPR